MRSPSSRVAAMSPARAATIVAVACLASSSGCWLSHELGPDGDAGPAPSDASVRDAAVASGVRCDAETCAPGEACARRLEEPVASCVSVGELPPPPPAGLGLFFPEWSVVRFCDDHGDCADGSRCLFWLGEAQVFACGRLPDPCEPGAPPPVCADDRECPACRSRCLPTGAGPTTCAD